MINSEINNSLEILRNTIKQGYTSSGNSWIQNTNLKIKTLLISFKNNMLYNWAPKNYQIFIPSKFRSDKNNIKNLKNRK